MYNMCIKHVNENVKGDLMYFYFHYMSIRCENKEVIKILVKNKKTCLLQFKIIAPYRIV